MYMTANNAFYTYGDGGYENVSVLPELNDYDLMRFSSHMNTAVLAHTILQPWICPADELLSIRRTKSKHATIPLTMQSLLIPVFCLSLGILFRVLVCGRTM